MTKGVGWGRITIEKLLRRATVRRAFIIFLILVWVAGSQGTILDVSIEPEEPAVFDAITIIIEGEEPTGAVFINDSDFRHEGQVLELDILLDIGTFHMVGE